MVMVTNMINTSNDTLPRGYESWLEFAGGDKKLKCSNNNCYNRQSDGAHVQYNSKVYIVPVCRECNLLNTLYSVPLEALKSRV